MMTTRAWWASCLMVHCGLALAVSSHFFRSTQDLRWPFIALAAAWIALSCAAKPSVPIRWNDDAHLAWAGLCVSSLFASAASPNSFAAMHGFGMAVAGYASFLSARRLQDHELHIFVKAGLCVWSVAGALLLAESHNSAWAVWPAGVRPAFTFGNRNLAAAALLPWVVFACFGVVEIGRRLIKTWRSARATSRETNKFAGFHGALCLALWGASSGLLLAALLATQSLGGGLAISVVALGIFWRVGRSNASAPNANSPNALPLAVRRVAFSWRWLVSLIAVVGAVLVGIYARPLVHALWIRFPILNNNPSIASRTALWLNAVSYASEHPFGFGTGNFDVLYPQISHRVLPTLGYELGIVVDHAHNDYIESFATQGVLGLFFRLMLFLSFFRKRSISKLRDACGLAGLAIALHAWVDFPMARPASLFFLAFFSGAGSVETRFHDLRVPSETRTSNLGLRSRWFGAWVSLLTAMAGAIFVLRALDGYQARLLRDRRSHPNCDAALSTPVVLPSRSWESMDLVRERFFRDRVCHQQNKLSAPLLLQRLLHAKVSLPFDPSLLLVERRLRACEQDREQGQHPMCDEILNRLRMSLPTPNAKAYAPAATGTTRASQ